MSIIQLNQLYYYEDLKNDAYALEQEYQGLVKTSVIGTSHDRRDIIMLKVGSGSKNIIVTAGVHGRESINPVVLMKMAEFYCQENKKALNRYSIYFIPLLNPDGYMIALRGYNIIKNEALRITAKAKKIPYQEWKYNARGVDINRNFPSYFWRSKQEGDKPASENETKALIHIFDTNPSEGYIDYHSRGKEIYYYRNRMNDDYNRRQKMIAERLADDTGYAIVPPKEEIGIGDTGGNTVHYYSEVIRKPAFTIETVPDEASFPININYQKETFEEILTSPLILLY